MSTSPERYARLKELLLAARELPAKDRAEFLRDRTDDPDLIEEALGLLARDDSAHALLDEGVVRARPQQTMPEQIGPYFIEGILGEGGMGVVYRARQEEPIRRHVALKLIRWGMHHETVVRRFEHERRTLALMDHPHIATVLDAGTDEQGHPWFVMPLVEGLPLLEFCDREKVGVDARLRLFEDICRAVHHAHGRGVLHRDLKPGNILVRRVSGRLVPVIIDFGIAKALQDEESTQLLTREGQKVGTPAYMSPEQLAGDEQKVDARSDVYALGVILYELLAGRHPFSDAEGRITRESDGIPKAPSTAVTDPGTGDLAARRGTSLRELRRQLRGDVDTICLMAVRPEPDRRYASAAHLADDLRRLREGHPVDARPDSWTYRTGKFIRRHPAATALSTAALLAILAGSLGLAWHASRLQLERDRARTAESAAVRELETSSAVVEFLGQMFELARPDQGGRADLTAIELIDLGVDEVPARLADEPWLQAELYRVLAVVNHGLFRNEQARQILERALAANDSIPDRDPSEVRYQRARILADMGLVEHDLGLTASGALSIREAIADYEASGLADSTEIASALNSLGINLQAEGMLAESVAPTERALRLAEAYGPADDPDVPWGWGSLGYINYQLGKLDLAVGQFEHALELARMIFDEDHFDLAHHINNLGGVYHRMGRLDEARVLLVENLEMNRRMFEAEPHGSLARAYQNLASLYLDTGRVDEAVALLDSAYAISVVSLGPAHPKTARPLAIRAIARQRSGDPVGARADAELSVSIAWNSQAPGGRDYERAFLTRGRIRTMQGDPGSALADLEHWQDWVQERYPEGHYARAEANEHLGEARLALGENEAARQLFEAAASAYESSFGPTHFRSVNARRLAAEASGPDR